jgi:hypothetical protein
MIKPFKTMSRKLPPGVGAFDSGHTDTAERAEEVLGGLGFGRGRADAATLRELQGSIKVGPGDPVEDVQRAREIMGTEDT